MSKIGNDKVYAGAIQSTKGDHQIMKTKSACNALELAEISNQLSDIAARLAGFKPILMMLGEKSGADVCDSLAMVAGMSEHLNERICGIADQLSDSQSVR